MSDEDVVVEAEFRAVEGTDGYRYLVSFYLDSTGKVRFLDVERLWEIEHNEGETTLETA